jgi:transcriptional regulator with XRE-family HTH domain
MWSSERLGKLLEKEGRTRKWLADKCGLKIGSLHAVMTGNRKPGPPVVKLMALALNTSEGFLLGEETHEGNTRRA